jgi:hypothetical protein
LILDLEFHQHLWSLKHVINIIMWFRDMGCYKHPHHRMMGVIQDHVEGFSTKREFTSTHTNHELSALNIEILQIEFKF